MVRYIKTVGCLLFISFLICTKANAADFIPRSAQADTVRKQAEQKTPAEAIQSIPDAPTLAVEVPPGAENVHFILKQVVIEGSTVYSKEELAKIYNELIGKEIALTDAYIIAAKVTQKYTQDGYVLSLAYIPPQKISDGIIHIDVTEGYVKEVKWKGEEVDSDIVKDMGNRLLEFRPLKGSDLEGIMLELNELPSIQATSSLIRGGDNEPGAVVIEITISRKRISAEFEINNSASRYLGVWQDSLQSDIAGLLTPIDKISLNYSSSVTDNFNRYYRAEYNLPLNKYGTAFKIGASKSRSAPGYTLEPLQVRSHAETKYIGLTHPIIRSREENLILSGQFNINNQNTAVVGTKIYSDRVRSLQLAATYNKSDNWDGFNLIDLNLYKGLNVLNATETGSASLSRPNGHSDFTKLDFTISRMQNLGSNFSLLVSSAGQISNSPLLSSEEFSYGGISFGKAYDASEITADEGLVGSLELRYDTFLDESTNLQPYIFYDGGEVWSKTDGIESVSGTSAGAGIKVQAFDALKGDLFIAWPLTYTPATPKLGAEDKQPRVGISMSLFY